MSVAQLTKWMAYFEMSDYIQSEMNKGDTYQAALDEWRAIVEIQAEARARRSR